MINQNDLRVIKTKELIRDTFFSLLEKQTLEKITIKDIVETARINRGTFYFHYADKYDLFESIENDVLEEMKPFADLITPASMEDAILHGQPLPHILSVLDYLELHKDFFEIVARNNRGEKFLSKISKTYAGKMAESLKAYPNTVAHKLFEYRNGMGIISASYTLDKWVHDGMKESKESIAQLLTIVIIKLFTEDSP